MNGTDLLNAFRSGSEDAFRALMLRYTNLVFSAAKRRLFSVALAEDVTQTVFTRLAQTVPRLKTDAELVGWLHRTTLHVAIDVWRSETRRRAREQEAASMEPAQNYDTAWQEISPLLDEALNKLNEPDRQALLLRYFDAKTMRQIGEILGVNEQAAKMRVSRATDRLRNQLAVRGVTCSMLPLGTVLSERSIEAAPQQLADRLSSMPLPVIATVGAISGLFLFGKGKVAALAAIVVLTVTVLVFSSAPRNESTRLVNERSRNAPSDKQKTVREVLLANRNSNSSSPDAAEQSENVRLRFRVLDAETGQGLADAKVEAAYFYAGGRGEGHKLVTDTTGVAAIPQPREGGTPGMNVFVNMPGYVPKAVGLGKTVKTEYVLKLDTAVTIGGTVVDEEGVAVSSVKIEALSRDEYREGGPNTDFQTITATTGADGRWYYPYIPKSYETADLYLTCSNYAVTRVSVPVGKQQESTNATVTIQHGFVIVGKVNDLQGTAVEAATVKELHSFGYRKLSTKTDANGLFAISGISDPLKRQVRLMVQAEGMAPQIKTVNLLERTNTIDFAVDRGRVLRGRVLDEAGNPIVKASVRTDFGEENQIDDWFRWRARTDAEGRFEWNSAPAEPVCMWFEADGYSVIRSLRLTPGDQGHDIRLKRRTE